MKFKRFNSIENTYRQKTIDTIVEQGKLIGKWVVEEKVHGANFSFWYDGTTMKTAKRSGFVDGENFFNSEIVVEKYGENVKSLFNHLKATLEDFHSIVVFGELYGGNYPHPDVENNKLSSVQNGLWYSPDIDFYAFDIKINVTMGDENDWKDNYFLNVDVTNDLFEKFGFFYARPLFIGSFDEAVEFGNTYNSTIPALLGLPEIENNTCEGNVLKPMEASYFWNGSRVVLKNKNEKFTEKKNNKPKIKKVVNYSDECNDLMATGLMFVTENRLRNVLSKYGTVDQKGFGRVMGLMNKDTIEDFLKENKDRFATLDKKEAKAVTKRIGQENSNLLRENFLNIIDGAF